MKITGIICCLALLCTACSEEKTELPWGSDNYIVSFSLTTGADTYPAVIRDGRITVSIPYNVSLEDAQVSYELCEHASIYPDPATVADWDQEWQFLVSSYDNQNDRTYLYTVERTDIATDGSLTLRTQAEVDAFARSGINTVEGNLTIGGEDEENPVTNLDGLKNLVSVRCDLTITAAYTGETLAGLENLTACESLRIGSAAHPNETLRQLSLPALKEIKGDLCVYGTALQTADFKSLQSVAGEISVGHTAYKNRSVATLDFSALTAAGAIRIGNLSSVTDFSTFTQVLPRLSEQTWSVTDCGYNPTYQQMLDGETGAESK